MIYCIHRKNHNQEDVRRYLYFKIENAKENGSECLLIAFSKKDYTTALINELKKLGYRVEVMRDGELLIQYKISWDMEKLTASEAKKIALSKSYEVKKMVDDCLLYIKSQAEEGKFICYIKTGDNESNKQAVGQLRDMGYNVSYLVDREIMALTIRW